MNHSQRTNGKNRKKNVNKRKQQPSVSSSTSKVEGNSHPSSNKSDEDDPVDEINEAEAEMENEEPIEQIRTPRLDESTRSETDKKHGNSSTNVRDESIVPMKPQASVAPVKQMSPNNNYPPKHNGYSSTNHHHHHHYPYSNHQNSLPPRFRQQIEQREAAMNNYHQKPTFRRRRGRTSYYRTFYPRDQPNDHQSFPSSKYEHEEQEQYDDDDIEQHDDYEDEQRTPLPPIPMNDDHPSPPPHPHLLQKQHQHYSSESELLSDATSTNATTSLSPSASTSIASQSPLRGLELLRTLSNSNGIFNDLVSLFDTVTFSTSELELLISKIATKHILNKQEVTRLLSTNKTDKSIERILDDTYLAQVKILAIELQAEKNRVVELTKTNADLDQTVRQLQQQGTPNLVQYQQAILSYQIQLRQLYDENARLRHQLHAYSMMPASLNETKQQNQILNEQLRQLTIRNSALENEASESERASKHAAEIYKKADSQKQEKIEQMIADINKYKKLDKELTALKQKHAELEKDFNGKVNEITTERDELKKKCELLEEQVKNDETLQKKYEQLIHHPSAIAKRQLEQEVNQLKAKNDELRKENWKVIDKINQLSTEKK